MPRRTVMAAALVVVLAGCGGTQVAGPPGTAASTTVVAGRGWLDEHAGWSGGDGEGAVEGAPAEAMAAAPAEAVADAAGAGGEVVPGPGPEQVGLSAGSVDDNERWDDYLRYVEDVERLGIEYRPYDVSGRRLVRVADDAGRPVLAASVEVRDAGGTVVSAARTDGAGRAVVFVPPAGEAGGQQQSASFTVAVAKGEASVAVPLAAAPATDVVLGGHAESAGAPQLDLLFVIDATGSMADEIERLKANMISVAERIAALESAPQAHFGMTVYRDRGDLFVTRTFDFTGDVAAFTAALGEVVADGGGDTPEDVEAALADAVAKPAWRVDDTVSLAFLVADAPPHLDYDASVPYTTSIDAARRAGIKVFPVASSGLDDQGEMVFRQLAQTTLGRFVFLTYGADGHSPGTSTPHHVDGYSTLALDDLVVQLVTDELAPRA